MLRSPARSLEEGTPSPSGVTSRLHSTEAAQGPREGLRRLELDGQGLQAARDPWWCLGEQHPRGIRGPSDSRVLKPLREGNSQSSPGRTFRLQRSHNSASSKQGSGPSPLCTPRTARTRRLVKDLSPARRASGAPNQALVPPDFSLAPLPKPSLSLYPSPAPPTSLALTVGNTVTPAKETATSAPQI